MPVDMDALSSRVSALTILPVITIVYLGITILLSAITSYVRTQSYKSLIKSNPQLLFDDIIIPSLQLVPSHFIFHPWTLWTSTFVETSPFQFIFGLFIIYFGLTFLESQWNPSSISDDSLNNIGQYWNSQQPISETLKFTTIVVIISNFVCTVLVTMGNMIYGSTENLNLPLQYGLFILILPLSVVAKQLTPETNIKILTLFKFRLKRLPFILITMSIIFSIVKRSASPFLPAFISFITSWCYLRYIQISPVINYSEILPSPAVQSKNTVSRGDPSDTFAFVEFFPDLVKPYAKPILEGLYQLSVLLGLVRSWNDEEVDMGNLRNKLRASDNNSGAPNTNADERRRQVALKVLEQSVERKDQA